MALKFKTISFVRGKVSFSGHDTVTDGSFKRDGARTPTDDFQIALQRFKALTHLISIIDQNKIKEQLVTSIHLRNDGEQVKAHVTIYSTDEEEAPVNQQTPWYALDSDQVELFDDFDLVGAVDTIEDEAIQYLSGKFKAEEQPEEEEREPEEDEEPEPTDEMREAEEEANGALSPEEAAEVAEEIANRDDDADGHDSGYGGRRAMGLAVNH